MILRDPPQLSGIFFAVWPRRVVTGELVMMEWLHWEYVEGWGWGSCGSYRFARWVPEKKYNQGERRKLDLSRLPNYEPGETDGISFDVWPNGRAKISCAENDPGSCAYNPNIEFMTPPDISKCKELRSDGPALCRYPHCTCMNVGGSTCGEPR